MRAILLYVLMTMLVSVSLSGCGTKGNLKTPAQMEQEKAKKAKKEEEKKKAEAEKAVKEKTEKENSESPAPEEK
jgi:predicted small lipoprotein YifL